MAAKSVTTTVPFDYIPVADSHLFEVRSGIDASFALSHAEIISSVVQSLLVDAVDDGDAVSGDTAYLCAFLMDTAKALRVRQSAPAT